MNANKVKILCISPLFAFLLAQIGPVAPKVMARLTQVIDGDTVVVRTMGGKQMRIRLLYIDALEKQQKFSDLAMNELKKYAAKKVQIQLKGKGHYGRWLGEIYYQGGSINYDLVRKGLVYLYPYSQFNSFRQKKRYYQAYINARLRHLGLWAYPRILSPWSFRRIQKKASY